MLYECTCYSFKDLQEDKIKQSLIVDVKVLVLKKYLVPPRREVAGTSRECSLLSDSHTEFKNMTSLYLFSSCFSFLCLGRDISLNEQTVPYNGLPRPLG